MKNHPPIKCKRCGSLNFFEYRCCESCGGDLDLEDDDYALEVWVDYGNPEVGYDNPEDHTYPELPVFDDPNPER